MTTPTYHSGMTQAEVADEQDTTLTKDDRCDRCGAQAKARVQLVAGELLFCGHHMRQHGAALANAVCIPRSL